MGKEASKTKVRDKVLEKVAKYLEEEYDTYVRPVGSGEYTMLIPDEEGNKIFANVKISIPRGKRNGEGGYYAYDGYKVANEYKKEMEAIVHERAIKQAQKEAEKKKKKDKDEEEDE